MPPPPTTLGPYRIEREIGRGGAAIVYLAQHERLERPVALKLLQPHLQNDAGFVERFLFEARAAARLDHPNIVAVYDAGQIDGADYIAMEYVEGESLADILRRVAGPLPLDFTTSAINQVAAALDYAHQRGVVHRDVKPSNILVRDSGHVLLTDFGIARAASLSASTQAGAILGTPEYMAPEQAESRPVDGRSDVYSLAIVAYHMLTGAPPFHGPTPQATLYAHLHQPLPDPRDRNPALSPALATVLATGAAKAPERRYPTAGAFAQALAGPSPAAAPPPPAAPSVTPPQPRRRGSNLWIFILIGFLLGLAALSLAVWGILSSQTPGARPPATPTPAVVGIAPTAAPPTLTLAPIVPPATPTPAATPIASPTAEPTATPPPSPTTAPPSAPRLAYVSDRTGSPQIYLLASDGAFDQPLTREGRNDHPFWSPDGSLIFFSSDRDGQPALWSMRPDGSEPTRIFAAADAANYSLSPDGLHVAFARKLDGQYDLFLDGAPWLTLPGDQTAFWWAPDGGRILFEDLSDGHKTLAVATLGSSVPVTLTAPGYDSWNPSWGPDGRAVAYASTLDGNAGIYRQEIGSGERVRLTPLEIWSQAPVWSADGAAIAYIAGEPDQTWTLTTIWADGSGRRPLYNPVFPEATAAWSKAGDRLAFLVDDGDREIAVIGRDGGGFRRLTNNSANDWNPVWEPR
ncbi:MAG: serine/threonine-protein kinase [Caldilineales bacterium]|nr:serine/threonine-protein kinase [Caldilineales bacterium]